MHEGYKLVFLTLTSTVIVGLFLLTYRFIYPKKKISLFALLLFICVPIIINTFRPGAYESGDFNIHIYRIVSFYTSMQQGHFMPSWSAELNATYGYPVFIFNYTLPYYIVSFFHLLGLSFIMSMKVYLAINFLLSGIFMYVFAKKLLKNDLAAFTTTIFYQFTPYHLIDQNFKIVVGEILFFTFLPLAFLFMLKFYKKRNLFLFFLSSFSIALLIMSHVVIALFTMALLFLYIFFLYINSKSKKYIFYTIPIYVVGCLMTCYVWLTPIFLSRYTILEKMKLGTYDSIPFWQLFYAPWRFGLLFQGPKGEISNLIGYTQLFIIVLLITLLAMKKVPQKYTSHILFWLTTTLVLCFLVTAQSNFIWNLSPLLAQTGSHRLFILIIFCISLLAGYLCLLYPKKQKAIYLLIFVTIFSTILNWGQRDVIPAITDVVLTKNIPLSTAHGEGHFYANSIFRNPNDPWFSQVPATHLDIIHGSGKIKEISRESTDHIYVVNATTKLSLRENTLFFPGWQIYDNKKLIAIGHDNEGVITFDLPKGLHLVKVVYTDLLIYKLLKYISILSSIVVVVYILFAWFSGKYQ